MPRYKDSYVDQHFYALLEETSREPILRLALRQPDVPYALSVQESQHSGVVKQIYSQIRDNPRNRWYAVSVRVGYRKHVVNSVESIQPLK